MATNSALAAAWMLALLGLSHGGPINRQTGEQNSLHLSVRNQSYTEQNVCVSDDVLYQAGDAMPAPTPCARCVCQPPSSLCQPVACTQRPGCKALLRPGHCCPDYQCECERDGRVYANGERLEDPAEPCRVCYCQGGEVVCATIECYRRANCTPLYVPGVCCPKYEHCPPLAMDDPRLADRPHHTRATFRPSGPVDDEATLEDQLLGASNVQESVRPPPTAPAPADAAAPTAATPADAAIKIDVPAVPWSDATNRPADTLSTDSPTDAPAREVLVTTTPTSSADLPVATTAAAVLADTPRPSVVSASPETSTPEQSSSTDFVAEEGSGVTTETGGEKSDQNAPSTNNPVEDAYTGTTINMEGSTEQEPLRRLFMLSKEAELDPTTVSAEYTDIPDEMSTTPEATVTEQETTFLNSVDFATEALIEASASTKQPTSPESSTDSSPEFKDFDEFSVSKSSEGFLKDSASHDASSSSSGDHHSLSSSSEEATSHVLSSNVDTTAVKPSESLFEGSSEGPTEGYSGASSEEALTPDLSSTTDKIVTKNAGTVEMQHSILKENQPKEKDVLENEKYTAEEEGKGENEKKQPTLVLDREATEENGPPVLLIGDELANHQMDIVVATSSTEEAETESVPVDKIKSHSETQDSTKDANVVTEANLLLDGFANTAETTADGEAATESVTNVQKEIVTKRAGESEESATTEGSSTERLGGTLDVMLSDAPLSGQIVAADITHKHDKAKSTPTDEKKEDSESQPTTEHWQEVTEYPVDNKLGEERSDMLENESTTNLARQAEQTTLPPKYETTTIMETVTEIEGVNSDEDVKIDTPDKPALNDLEVETEKIPSATENEREKLVDSNTEKIDLEQVIGVNDSQVKASLHKEDERSELASSLVGEVSQKEHAVTETVEKDEESTTTPSSITEDQTNGFSVTDNIGDTTIAIADIMLGDQSYSGIKLQTVVDKQFTSENSKENKELEMSSEKIKTSTTHQLKDMPENADNLVEAEKKPVKIEIFTTVKESDSDDVTTEEHTTETQTETQTQITKKDEEEILTKDSEMASEKPEENRNDHFLEDVKSQEISKVETPVAPEVTTEDAVKGESDTSSPDVNPHPVTSTPALVMPLEDTDTKINPEVLELKPPSKNITATAAPAELEATTLSPLWLKANDSTQPEEGEKAEAEAASGSAQQNKEEGGDGAKIPEQTHPGGSAEDGSRMERRADETDRKDLHLLEDFFTKLYRHQIATDGFKQH